jgi:hypothetical protein
MQIFYVEFFKKNFKMQNFIINAMNSSINLETYNFVMEIDTPPPENNISFQFSHISW